MVGEDIGVGGHDGVADLHGPCCCVEGGADEVDDGHAGGEFQGLIS